MYPHKKTDLIFLLGPMGAGKSTIGPLLAKQLHFTFIDTDALIEQQTQSTITHIFALEGEQGFRNRETQVLADCAVQSGCVVACGGGVVVREQNRLLLQQGVCIFLQVSIEYQFKRIGQDKSRPLLQAADPKEQLHRLAAQREPLYRQCADITVMTDALEHHQIVSTIVAHLHTL